LVPDEEVRNNLREQWRKDVDKEVKMDDNNNNKTQSKTENMKEEEDDDDDRQPSLSATRWSQLVATVNSFEAQRKQQGKYKLANELAVCVASIILHFCYVRLDFNVSIHRNHLLKSPFVIHPKTGKVCVPILDVANCHEFDPESVPNLATLVHELDALSLDDPSEDVIGGGGDNGGSGSGGLSMDVEGDAKRKKIGDSGIAKTSLKPYIEGFEKNFLTPLYRDIVKEMRSVEDDW
jgi:DNA primase catalytic subunit